MNRREFVAASSAVAAGLTCGLSSATAPTQTPVFRDIACVLFDRRFEQSRAFGAAAERLHQCVFGIDGDLTALWTGHLDPLWRSGTGAVVGMTTAAGLVCLQQLAAQYWFRVIARVEHRNAEPQGVSRRIIAEPQWTIWHGAPSLISWHIARRPQRRTTIGRASGLPEVEI